MKKHLAIVTILLLSAYVLPGCILDPKETPNPPPPDNPVLPDLKEKDNVFEYLDIVYENMDRNKYEKLLDDDFTFFFSQADYGDGITPEQWRRSEELASARNMFSREFSHPKYGSITKIELELFPEGLWIEVPKTEPPYEGETWYSRTVQYRIIIDTTSEWTLQGTDKKALFTVRLAEVDGEPEPFYRIVQWHDGVQ